MYAQGDRVLVEGFRGKRGVLRVWQVRERGLALCTDQGYERLVRGKEAPAVGFTFDEIVEIIEPQRL